MEKNTAIIVMQDTDNIGIAIRKINKGETVTDAKESVSIQAQEDIPFGFKVAVRNIELNAIVYKYGEPIGQATSAITMGQLVHVHNIGGLRGRGDL